MSASWPLPESRHWHRHLLTGHVMTHAAPVTSCDV